MDPRVTVMQSWGLTQIAVQVEPGQLYGAMLEEEARDGIVIADVCLFLPEMVAESGAWWGLRYEIPTAFVPIQDVLLQAPSNARLGPEYTFYEVPEALKFLEDLAVNLEVGEFRTEYLGPDEDAAVVMNVVRARGRAKAQEILSDLLKAMPRKASMLTEDWLNRMADRLQSEGYGLWRDGEGYFYVSARPDRPAAYYKRALGKARNLAMTTVPPYVVVAQTVMEQWIRTIVKDEVCDLLKEERK